MLSKDEPTESTSQSGDRRARTTRRRWLKLTGAGVTTGLAGCTSGDGGGGAGDGGGNSNTTVGTSTEKSPWAGTTIEYRSYNGPGLDKFFETHTKKFEKETGITVKWDLLGWSNGFSKQLADITSRSGPDCGEIPSSYLPQQMKAGGWVKMEQYFDDDRYENLNPDAWFESPVKETATYQAKDDSEPHIYPVPWYWGPRGQVTNIPLTKEAGVSSRPETWDDLVSHGKTFRETFPKKNFYGVEGNSLKMFSNLLWQQGGTFFDDRYNPTEAKFNSAKGVKALNFWKKLLTKHKTIPQSSVEWDNAAIRSAFYNDQVGAVMGNIGFANVYLENNTDAKRSDFTLHKPPKGPGSNGQSSVFFGEEGLGIHPWSDKKEASAAWIDYLLRPEVNAELAATVGFLPAVKKSYNEFEPFTKDELLQDFKDIMPIAKTWPVINGWSKTETIMIQLISDELSTAVSQNSWQAGDTEKALNDAANRVNSVLSE